MSVYLICGCLGEGGKVCLQLAWKGCSEAALAVPWATAAVPAIAAHHFLSAVG